MTQLLYLVVIDVEKIAVLLLTLLLVSVVEAQQFLVVPLPKSSNPTVTEGYIYSQEEHAIHGVTNHNGVDFACPYGTRVYAAADGLAISSFHSRLIPGRLWKGKEVGFSLGHFVQIWHKEQGLYTCYGHLSAVAPNIPYLAPVQSKTQPHDWDPKGIYLPGGTVPDNCVEVRRGDLIGYVGDSGLTWGYDETPDHRPDRKKFSSWDEDHLHFGVYTRGPDGKKDRESDPFCVYSTADAYNLANLVSVAGMWLFDLSHHLIWASE